MTREVIFAPDALADLAELYSYIAERGGADRTAAYILRITATCRGLATFPMRGRRRDDIRPGLRVIGHERRVAIAFHNDAERVTIDRVLYAGRDLGSAFEN